MFRKLKSEGLERHCIGMLANKYSKFFALRFLASHSILFSSLLSLSLSQTPLPIMAASALVMDPKPTPELPPSVPSTRSDLQSNFADQTSDEDDLYGRLKSLQRQIEFIDIQEEYVKDEQKNLKRELLRAQEEVKRIQSVPLVIGQFMEMVDQNNGIVGSTTGSNYYVRILSTINRELLKPSASVALHRHSNALVDVLPPEADSSISLLSQSEKPDVTYNV